MVEHAVAVTPLTLYTVVSVGHSLLAVVSHFAASLARRDLRPAVSLLQRQQQQLLPAVGLLFSSRCWRCIDLVRFSVVKIKSGRKVLIDHLAMQRLSLAFIFPTHFVFDL